MGSMESLGSVELLGRFVRGRHIRNFRWRIRRSSPPNLRLVKKSFPPSKLDCSKMNIRLFKVWKVVSIC